MPAGTPIPDALPDRLRAHLKDAGLVRVGDSVTVALSGGLDSVVLLHLLRFPLADLRLDLTAAHFDHRMRRDSHADALWVRGLCRTWGVSFESGRARRVPGSEAEARRVRYAFLENVAPAESLVLTAHHLDDQAETVLFRIARGTGVRGLRGILPRRERIVRPLLPFRRTDLETYARSVRVRWRADPSNLDPSYARNRLRHRALPELEQLLPDIRDRLARLAGEAQAVEEGWEEVLPTVAREAIVEEQGDVLTLARPLLLSYHPHLRARLLRHLLRRYGTPPGRAGTRAALEFISSGPGGGEVHLPGGVRIQRDFDRIRLAPAPGREQPEDRPLRIDGLGRGAGRARIGGAVWHVEWRPVAGRDEERSGAERHVVVPSPAFPLQVRGRRPGDRIRFDYGSKKLKKLMNERRLDRHERRRVPVLVDAGGRVLWAVGHARAADVSGGGDGLEIVVRDARQH